LLLFKGPLGATDPIEPAAVRIIDGDTIEAHGAVFRLVGFDASETGRLAQCSIEAARGAAARARLVAIVAAGGLDLGRVACSCRPGTEGAAECNHGRLCGTLRARGRDVGAILISEGLRVPMCAGLDPAQLGNGGATRVARQASKECSAPAAAVDAFQFSVTIDHAVVRAWAERRAAHPSIMMGDYRPWPLLFDFGSPDVGVREIEWDRFFGEFERANLAFVYRDVVVDGALDDYYELINRSTVPDLMLAAKSTIVARGI
jgi:endonuclease YncB( thermonuclease family)